MYEITYSKKFKRSAKLCRKRGLPIDELHIVVDILATEGKLPSTYSPHRLSGKYKGIWECHIKSDWLLLWQQDDEVLTLLLLDTGTHSDIF